ncbi:hypothetical protein [Plantibacter cousiniae (nom. nud.)]|uniref:Lipoprotein n=1 Tax=Plantibacter cousiniae (nom. nud.) TaxID=199709 RepID=A0ABY1LPP8_9MICO|nr:hypothetical protein [Plantibacter cousiniae]SKC70879.1 hypothetical protein SAMN06295973_3255 [Plantibacter cousiniae]
MTAPHRSRLALVWGSGLLVADLLAGCSALSSGDRDSAVPSTPTATATADVADGPADHTAFCAANRAAATAKSGTVGEDLEAVQAQVTTIRDLLQLDGVSAEVAAGAEVFATSAEETAAILAEFPADSLVSDVGLDPRFTESQALQSAATDPNYQAFIAWTIQTCGFDTAGE